jgi:hypothetical protein
MSGLCSWVRLRVFLELQVVVTPWLPAATVDRTLIQSLTKGSALEISLESSRLCWAESLEL